MKGRDFLFQVPELLRLQLPPELRDFETLYSRGGLVKVHYGDPSVHYEVWLQRRRRQLELGLHFEGAPEANSRHLEGLTAHLGDIRSALGEEVEAEQWTHSWTRLHLTIALEELDEELLMEVSSRLAQFIRVLQPMIGDTA